MSLHIVILAAGLGKRMHSALPKVLHPIGGEPMLGRVLTTAQLLQPAQIHVIHGHEGEKVKSVFAALNINWIPQEKQSGTGHAVLQALPHVPTDAQVLVLYGDVPLLRVETLNELVQLAQSQPSALALLIATLENPFGLGRIIRDSQQRITGIVEEKDATQSQRDLREIYSGICCTSAVHLKNWLPKVEPKNAQGEYYFTDIIAMAQKESAPTLALSIRDPSEILGINDRAQLQTAERIWQHRKAKELLLAGVTLADTQRIDIRGELQCEQDVFIDVNSVFIGNNFIGTGSVIEPNCMLTNVTLGKNCHIMASSVLDGCVIGDHGQIGPFARIRPGTQLAAHCKIGNFVEAKKAVMGEHSKASHLSYLGDVTIGKDVNIGAGTITCNYDGANKHQTIIEDGVHIGSDTQLIAPVTVGKNATIGAGSTIRTNAPPNELTLSMTSQKTIYGWQRKKPIEKK